MSGSPALQAMDFPANQSFADLFESALCLLRDYGVLDRYRQRLENRDRGVLAEIWTAHFLHRAGFKIIRWEPEYVPPTKGDFEIALQNGVPIFVEVKCPGWQGELAEEEREAGRKQQPKYLQAEGHSYDNAASVVHSVEKALRKLSPRFPNLVVVADDLFVSPLLVPDDGLFESRFRRLTLGAEFDVVSGVLLLLPAAAFGHTDYKCRFYEGRGVPLPEDVRRLFSERKCGCGESD